MDELSKVIANLIGSLPSADSGGGSDPAPPSDEETPAVSENAGASNMLASLGGGDLMGMLSSFGGNTAVSNKKLQLLVALKPHVCDERCAKIDQVCKLVNTAYGIRGALGSLGGILNV